MLIGDALVRLVRPGLVSLLAIFIDKKQYKYRLISIYFDIVNFVAFSIGTLLFTFSRNV